MFFRYNFDLLAERMARTTIAVARGAASTGMSAANAAALTEMTEDDNMVIFRQAATAAVNDVCMPAPGQMTWSSTAKHITIHIQPDLCRPMAKALEDEIADYICTYCLAVWLEGFDADLHRRYLDLTQNKYLVILNRVASIFDMRSRRMSPM